MAKRTYVIGAGTLAIMLGLFLGVASGFTMSKGSPASAQTQPDNSSVPGPQTNEKIEALAAELNKVSEYEKSFGCMTFDANKTPTFCGASKERVDNLLAQYNEEVHKLQLANRSPEDLATVSARIKDLAGDQSTTVSFLGTSANPYTNVTKRMEQWSDSKGFVYWVNPTNNAVIQFGPGPGSKPDFERDGSKSLSMDVLKQTAEEYLSKTVADFDSVKADYSFRESSKPGNVSHAFRWEAKSKPTGEDVTPFVQVVLSPTGQVMSFDDVRSLYSN